MTASVSVVIPALNEARHIEACLRSVFNQETDGELEVIVVDGGSDDATAEIAERLGARVIANPRGSIPAGLNRGLAAARGDVFARFDAHSEMTPDYVRACLRVLGEETGAVNVGGWSQPVGEGPWGRALGAALVSPFGVGNPRLWREPDPGTPRSNVETVPYGCFPTSALREVQGWREDILANEDFELNHRLRRRGGRVVFDPQIRSIYRPRETYSEIVRQYWHYGNWKGFVVADSPESLVPRQLAPPVLLVAAAGAPFARPFRIALLAYAGAITALAVHSRGGWRTAGAVASIHVAWGAGLLTGWLRSLRASRMRS